MERITKNRITLDLLRIALPAIATLLAATTAYADGVCFKGYRDTTVAERATMTAVLDTVRGALPDAPEGWVIVGDDQLSVLSGICMDVALWTYQHTRHYQRVDDQAAQEAMTQRVTEGIRADMAAKQPRLDAIMARNIELSNTAAAAAQAGDYARVETINQEIQANGQEYESILAEGGARARATAELEESGRDREMSVSAVINPGGTPGDGSEAIAVPPGASAAYLWRNGDSNSPVNALVMLGQWRPAPEYGLQPVPRAGVAAEAPHAISVRIRANANRLPAAIDATDFSALAAILRD